MLIIFTSHKELDVEHNVRTHIPIERLVLNPKSKEKEKETVWYCGTFSHTNDIEEAKDLRHLTEDALLQSLTDVVSKLSAGESAKVIQVATQVVTVELIPDADAFKESMRHSGLSKLTQAERDALGLGSLATYDKVKFHGGANAK